MALPPPAIIACAQRAQRAMLVPTSVQLAQWEIESGNGLHAPGHNPFGIKAKPGDPYVTCTTREEDAQHHSYFVQARSRRFLCDADAFDYHAKLLATAPVYALAMAVLKTDTGRNHAAVVQRFINLMGPHYATASNYASVLWAATQPLLSLDTLPPLKDAA